MNLIHWDGESLGCWAILLIVILGFVCWPLLELIFGIAIGLLAIGIFIALLVFIPCASYRLYFAYKKRKPGDMLGRYFVGIGSILLVWMFLITMSTHSNKPEIAQNTSGNFDTVVILLFILSALLLAIGLFLGSIGLGRKALIKAKETLQDVD